MGLNKITEGILEIEKNTAYCKGYEKGFAKIKTEYDKLKEDNEKLQAYNKDLIESNTDLSNVRNRLHGEKMKLREDNALLIEALENVISSWNKRMGGDIEELKTTNIHGDVIKFWSPIASLIDSEPIHKAKELLTNIKK